MSAGLGYIVASGGNTLEQMAHECSGRLSLGCRTDPYTLERVGSLDESEGIMSEAESANVVESFRGEEGRGD